MYKAGIRGERKYGRNELLNERKRQEVGKERKSRKRKEQRKGRGRMCTRQVVEKREVMGRINC